MKYDSNFILFDLWNKVCVEEKRKEKITYLFQRLPGDY